MIKVFLAVFTAFAVLYLSTAQRGVSWQDSGQRQWRILHSQYSDELGLALAHPLFIAVGRAAVHWGVGDVLFRLSCISALSMAAAAALLAVTVSLLTGRRWIGFASGAMLAVCHAPWWLATITEAYCLQLLAMSAEILLLVLLVRRPNWWLLTALAAVSGLDLCIHNLAFLPLPVYAAVAIVLVVRKRLPWWSLATAAAAYLAGASLFLSMIIGQMISSGLFSPTIQSALFGKYKAQVYGDAVKWPWLKANAALAAMNFFSFLLPLAVAGWLGMRRKLGRELAYPLIAITVIEIVFVVRYFIPDQFMFLLPSLLMIALAAGIGAGLLCERSRGWTKAVAVGCVLSIILPPALYAAAPSLLKAAGWKIHHRQLPFRDEARYWLTPWKDNEVSADRFAFTALEQVPGDAVIMADATTYYPLRLMQELTGLKPNVEYAGAGGEFPDYQKSSEEFRKALDNRPLYVVTPVAGYVPEKIMNDAEFLRDKGQVLYKVVWKQPPASRESEK